MDDYNWADLIDKADKVRMLADPASDYMKAGVWAMGRKMDDIIIAAMSGNATTIDENDASSNVALPAAQKVAVSATTDMNITKLMQAKKILDASDVDPDLPRHIVMKSNQFYDLLGDSEIQSSDYNTVKALVAGDIDTFMGFKFHRSERLAQDASSDTLCLAWIPEGIGLSMGMDVKTEISERADKNHSTQVYAQMCLGAVRIEDEKVVEIACTAVTTSDVMHVMVIPSGVRILPQSFVIVSDLETSATVDVGYAAHTTQSTGAAVAVDVNAFCTVIDAASARTVTHFHESTTHDTGYVTTGEMILTLSMPAGSAVAADTFDFHIMYADPN